MLPVALKIFNVLQTVPYLIQSWLDICRYVRPSAILNHTILQRISSEYFLVRAGSQDIAKTLMCRVLNGLVPVATPDSSTRLEWAWHCYGNDRHGHAMERHDPSEVKLAVFRDSILCIPCFRGVQIHIVQLLLVSTIII